LTVSGEIQPESGIVVNITDIDKLLKSEVISKLDGKFLNREVEYFKEHSTTTENIAQFVNNSLANKLPTNSRIVSVRVDESETLWSAIYHHFPSNFDKNDRTQMTQLTRKYDFSAAHRLHSPSLSDEQNVEVFGKCNHPNFHGHNYEIEISLSGTPDNKSGMLFDISQLDKIVDENILKPMDHRNLNLDIEEFEHSNPTSEMLAVVIWNRLSKHLPTQGDPKLAKVLVRETARNEFEYFGD
jgi:6-pyruvoyltetrahydropterin/6-carboxytetrahydropterin synthase